MLAFNYAAAIFVISVATYILMSLFWGKGILESLTHALIIGGVLGFITLISAILFLHKKHIKVYELKDEDTERKR